jgi:hypothetical protein
LSGGAGGAPGDFRAPGDFIAGTEAAPGPPGVTWVPGRGGSEEGFAAGGRCCAQEAGTTPKLRRMTVAKAQSPARVVRLMAGADRDCMTASTGVRRVEEQAWGGREFVAWCWWLTSAQRR